MLSDLALIGIDRIGGVYSCRSIDELAENLRLILDSEGIRSGPELIFVVHSMGGLVTRALLTKYRDIAQRVKLIYFFATPTTGSEQALKLRERLMQLQL